jgi:hypothetical protein
MEASHTCGVMVLICSQGQARNQMPIEVEQEMRWKTNLPGQQLEDIENTHLCVAYISYGFQPAFIYFGARTDVFDGAEAA